MRKTPIELSLKRRERWWVVKLVSFKTIEKRSGHSAVLASSVGLFSPG